GGACRARRSRHPPPRRRNPSGRSVWSSHSLVTRIVSRSRWPGSPPPVSRSQYGVSLVSDPSTRLYPPHAARVRGLPGGLRRPATGGRGGAAPHPSRHGGRDRRRRGRLRPLLGARAPLPRGVLARVVVAPRLPRRRRADETHPCREGHLHPLPADQSSR